MDTTQESARDEQPVEDTAGHGVVRAAGGSPCAICSAVTPVCWRNGFSCGRFRKQWSVAVEWPISPYRSARPA